MITVQRAVETILNNDLQNKNALSDGFLNMSKYAEKILSNVEKNTMKQVSKQTIVVAISRFKNKIIKTKYIPKLNMNLISIKKNLIQIILKKIQKNSEIVNLKDLENIKIPENTFFSVSIGTDEVDIVCDKNISLPKTNLFRNIVKKEVLDLVGVGIKFEEKQIEEPNIGYTILHKLSLKKIPLYAGITTGNEFTVVFKNKYLQEVLSALEE
jgi:hypothetical protein